MDGTNTSSAAGSAEGKDGASPEERAAYRAAHRRWKLNETTETQRDLLVTAIPILRGIWRRTRSEFPNGERTEECGALAVVEAALTDRLKGFGWPSLATSVGGQGINHIQHVAISFALEYVDRARAGDIVDTDPIGTVCKTYKRRQGKPLARDSLSRWERKYGRTKDNFLPFFKGDKLEATEMAQCVLRQYGTYLSRRPSDTSITVRQITLE